MWFSLLPLTLATTNFQERAVALLRASPPELIVKSLVDLVIGEIDPLIRSYAAAALRITHARASAVSSDETLRASKIANQAFEALHGELEEALASVSDELLHAGASAAVADAVVASIGEVKDSMNPLTSPVLD